MIAKIYHATGPISRTMHFVSGWPSWPDGYIHVADAWVGPHDTADEVALERAFRLTNHIDRSWQENTEVIPQKGQQRSTEVGDVVIVNETAYRCEMCGWSAIEEALR